MRPCGLIAFLLLVSSAAGQAIATTAGPNATVEKSLQAELQEIFHHDQDLRLAIDPEIKAHGFNSPEVSAFWRRIDAYDKEDLAKVAAILDQYGWLGPQAIGSQGNNALFLVIQHADLRTQEKYLPMLRAAVPSGRASGSQLALLEDRVALRHGRPQIYGSQLQSDPKTGKYSLSPLEDPEHVDDRRAAVGLGPLANYLKHWDLTWNPEPSPGDLGPMLKGIVAARGVPGLAVLMLKNGNVAVEGAAGVRRFGRPEPLGMEDPFLLCSATKAMTATVAAMAVEQGKLSWSSTVGDVLANSPQRINDGWRSATLADLLDHRGGAPADTARIWTLARIEFLTGGTPRQKRSRIVRGLLSRPPAYAPGTRYAYSTLDYLIVETILENAFGSAWEDCLRDQLWTRLTVSASAGFGPPPAMDGSGPYGHLGILFPRHPLKPGGFWARLTMPQGFGMARMTLGDWAKFAALHLRGDPANPHCRPELLSAGAFAALHDFSGGRYYHAGWFRAELSWHDSRLTKILTSQGDNYAWHVEAWLLPEIDTAVLIACNEGGPEAAQPASLASRDALLALRLQITEVEKQQ